MLTLQTSLTSLKTLYGLNEYILTKGAPYKPPLPSVLFDAFDDNTQTLTTTNPNGRSVSFDSASKFQGVAALNVYGIGNTGASYATRPTNSGQTADPATVGPVVIRVDGGEDPEYCTLASVQSFFGRSGTYYTLHSETGLTQLNLGPRWITADPKDVVTLGTLGYGKLDVRVMANHGRNAAGPARFDAIAAVKPKGKIIFALDDIPATQYTIGLGLFQARNIKGVQLFVPTDLVDGNVSFPRMTKAQIGAWRSFGAGISPNGTSDDAAMTTKADVAAVISGLTAQNAYLDANGLSNGGDKFTVYTNGTQAIAGTTTSVTSVTSNGTAVVTMASTTGILAGYRASGYLVRQSPPVTVLSVDSGTQLTLSANVSAGTSRMDFTDTSGSFHTGKLYSGLKNAGFTFVRTAGAQGPGFFSAYEGGGIGRRLAWPNYSISNNWSLATIQSHIDQACALGTTIVMLIHGIESNNTDTLLNVGQAKLEAILDYVAAKRTAGVLECDWNINTWAQREFNQSWPV